MANWSPSQLPLPMVGSASTSTSLPTGLQGNSSFLSSAFSLINQAQPYKTTRQSQNERLGQLQQALIQYNPYLSQAAQTDFNGTLDQLVNNDEVKSGVDKLRATFGYGTKLNDRRNMFEEALQYDPSNALLLGALHSWITKGERAVSQIRNLVKSFIDKSLQPSDDAKYIEKKQQEIAQLRKEAVEGGDSSG